MSLQNPWWWNNDLVVAPSIKILPSTFADGPFRPILRRQSSFTHEGRISSCSCFHNSTSLRLLKKGKVVFISLYVCNHDKTFDILQSLSLRKLSLSRCSSPEDIESEKKPYKTESKAIWDRLRIFKLDLNTDRVSFSS